MKPNSSRHNPSPDYLRALLKQAGQSQRGAAKQIGIAERTIRYYLSGDRACPYPEQFCLEVLAKAINMTIKIPKNENIYIFELDRIKEDGSDPVTIRSDKFINLNNFESIEVYPDYENRHALEAFGTENCTKNIAFCNGGVATVLAFTKESESEYQRIRRLIDEYHEWPLEADGEAAV